MKCECLEGYSNAFVHDILTLRDSLFWHKGAFLESGM